VRAREAARRKLTKLTLSYARVSLIVQMQEQVAQGGG